MQNEFDFVAIGDTVVDTFIRLEQAEEVWDVNHVTEKLCMSFADKIPYEFDETLYAVGNSPNASVSASRLGLKTALVSNIGDDDLGKKCSESLKQNKVNSDFVKVNEGMRTNLHYVLWFHDDRTILIKHENYNYDLPDIGKPKVIYISSLRSESSSMYDKIADYLEKNPEVNLTFQPGVFDIKLGVEKLQRIYKRAGMFFCNVDESRRILKTQESDIKKLLKGISVLGPRITVVTDGKNGAYTYDGTDYWFIKAYPDPKPPYERTGSGDAFASTFTSAITLGKTVGEALQWASINAMSVVQQIGAQKGLLTAAGIEEWLAKKPEGWAAEKI